MHPPEEGGGPGGGGVPHLHELHAEFPVEGGHLALHAQLPPPDGEGHHLIVGGAVAHPLKDVQVLHHHVAVQAHVKHLSESSGFRGHPCDPAPSTTTILHVHQ